MRLARCCCSTLCTQAVWRAPSARAAKATAVHTADDRDKATPVNACLIEADGHARRETGTISKRRRHQRSATAEGSMDDDILRVKISDREGQTVRSKMKTESLLESELSGVCSEIFIGLDICHICVVIDLDAPKFSSPIAHPPIRPSAHRLCAGAHRPRAPPHVQHRPTCTAHRPTVQPLLAAVRAGW